MSSEELDRSPEDLEARLIALEITIRMMLEEMSDSVRAKIAAKADAVEVLALDSQLTDVQIAQLASLLRSMR